MSKHRSNEQDVVIIGGGTSGVMCALGAVRYGLKVTLVCNKPDFSHSSLLTEFIPGKAFVYSASLVDKIKRAKYFGVNASLAPINISRVNSYVQSVVQELQQENDLEAFEKLGGSILTGTARFVNKHTILVGNIQIYSKYFVIATGTRDAAASNIIDFEQGEPIKYRQIFYKNSLAKKTIIIGSRVESLEIAQSLAIFGSKITLVCHKPKILPLEDQELVKKLQNVLEQEGITFYLSTKILQFYWQNQRKLLVCQDSNGDKFALDAEEIIDMRDPLPNVEDLTLQNTSIQYCSEGIGVNSRLQTGEKNIFAIGSVVKSSFKSVHLVEHQINVILSNIVFKVPRKINYKLIPRVLFTCPQLATVGINQILPSEQNQIKVLQFDFNKIDAAILQRNSFGEVKLICQGDKLLGASVLGPMASELIAEYSFVMQVGAGVSDIANSIHPYPTLSQINKRAAHRIFNKKGLVSPTTVAIEKAMHKMHQMAAMLSFAT